MPSRTNTIAQGSPRGDDDVEGSELRLVRRVADGEPAAFDALYRLYHPRLARFLDRITRRQSVIDEVVDDTMLVVWKRAGSFNGRSKVSTWIFAIAYRKALKALKRWDEPIEDLSADAMIEAGPGPEAQVGAAEARVALLRALATLPLEQRSVVDLTYFHGIGYREIAQIIDCPVDTVKTRMFHARRKLRAQLAGGLEDWL